MLPVAESYSQCFAAGARPSSPSPCSCPLSLTHPSSICHAFLTAFQYHDMGLIGSVLALLFCGGSGFYMSPASFIKRPGLWVELISRHRGTHMQVGHLSPRHGRLPRHVQTIVLLVEYSRAVVLCSYGRRQYGVAAGR